MGHWADDVVPEVKERLGIGGDDRDAEILANARLAQSEIELLAGHRFEPQHFALSIEHGGLPFVATLDTQAATLRANTECWPIPDPVHPQFANALQVGRAGNLASHAVGKAEALCAGAAVLAAAHRDGLLSLAPRVWFLDQVKAGPSVEFGRRLMDPGRRVHVPVVAGDVEGWWLQVSRRVYFVTKDTPDEPGLVEMLAPPGEGLAFVAGEPILIVARMTEHPSDWVFVARVWATEGAVRPPRPWRIASAAVHGHGVPILCLDGQSTPEEAIAEVLLLAYWHGYLHRDETTLIPQALAAAFPKDVARVMRGTAALDQPAAAAVLFERLLRPGFDPTRGAGSIRRYIARHATTIIRDYHSTQAEFHGWDEFGINERHYYKLLARFAAKGPDGRYAVDDTVKAKIRAHVAESRQRKAATELLRGHGFRDAAARKRLQRHGLDEIATAQPRRARTLG